MLHCYFCDKCGFANLANSRTPQLMSLKYLIEYQSVQIFKCTNNQNLKARKVTKNKHTNNAVLNENEKKTN